jgi:hypothetical protein
VLVEDESISEIRFGIRIEELPAILFCVNIYLIYEWTVIVIVTFIKMRLRVDRTQLELRLGLGLIIYSFGKEHCISMAI